MRRGHIATALLVILSAFAAELSGADGDGDGGRTGPTTQRIAHAVSMIEVDGVVDEDAWGAAWSTELPYEVNPRENVEAPVRTEVYLTYDEGHLYVGFKAYDPDPSAIRAHLTDRDRAWSDDWVGVALDTFNDERRNFLFVVNPMGVQMDQIETFPNGETAWDGIWHSAGVVTDWGWSAEMKIPFSTLRFQRAEGSQVWGFDGVRKYPRAESHMMGAFARDRNNNCYLCQAIKIEGFDGVSPGRNLEITPTVTGARAEERDVLDGEEEWAGEGAEADAGLTVQWGITPNMVLSGTVNPDFSQVEADAFEVDVNEPFALFFPEKRPFFMEGADYFTTPMNAVYTRTLRDPGWGGKLTGREGPHTLGAYVVQDDVTNLIFPGNQSSDGTSLDLPSLATVARYRYDLGSRHSMGFLMTDREGDEYFNRVAGLDGDFRISDTHRVRVQALGSRSMYPDSVAEEFEQPLGEFDDLAVDLHYEYDTRTWSGWALYQDIGDNFRADLGFMPRVGFKRTAAGGGYTWQGDENTRFSRLHFATWVLNDNEASGDPLLQEAGVNFEYQGPPWQSHAFTEMWRSQEVYGGREYDLTNFFVHQCMAPSKSTFMWLNIYLGDRIDYANSQPGERQRFQLGIDQRIGRHLRLELRHTYEKMKVEGGRLYTANVGQLSAAYQFNTRVFIRALTQYVDYDYNADLYVDEQDPEYQRVFLQLLFSYKLNPRTVLFLGYSENREGDHQVDLAAGERSLFAKIGYAWTL